jgi:chromosome segregation ATPase
LHNKFKFALSHFYAIIRNGQLQRENGELKGQLKLLRKKLKDINGLESMNLRAELDQTRSSLNLELNSLHQQNDAYKEQLRRECSLREIAEQDTFKAKNEMATLQKSLSDLQVEMRDKERDLKRSNRSLQQLQSELSNLHSTMEQQMIPRSELDNFKRKLQGEADGDVSKRMTEMKDMLEQQTINYQRLEAQMAAQENDRRNHHNTEMMTLKQKLNTVLADAERNELEITNMSSEAKRYQVLVTY